MPGIFDKENGDSPIGFIVMAALAGATGGISAAGWAFSWSAFATTAILGGLSQILAPTPQQPSSGSGVMGSQGRLVTVRQPIPFRQVIVGRCRVGGALTYIEQVGSNLHLVITWAGHQCQQIESIYFDDELQTVDGSGNVNSGTFAQTTQSQMITLIPGTPPTGELTYTPESISSLVWYQDTYGDLGIVGTVMTDVSPAAPSADSEYSLSGTTLTFNTGFTFNNNLICNYQVATGTVPPPGGGTSYAKIQHSLGNEADGVQPFPDLVTASDSKWTNAHCQTGCCKSYIRLTSNPEKYPRGIPNITAVIKGALIEDPRQSPMTTSYGNNAALWVAHYLADTDYGLGAGYSSEIDETDLVAAANVCDESVSITGGGYGGFAKFSQSRTNSRLTLSNNNLTATANASLAQWATACTNEFQNAGILYFEVTIGTAATPPVIGFATNAMGVTNNDYVGRDGTSYGYNGLNGYRYRTGPDTATAYGATFTTGDVISGVYDTTANTLNFWKNGVDQGVAWSSVSDNLSPAITIQAPLGAVTINTGASAWAYTPPVGAVGFAVASTESRYAVNGAFLTSEKPRDVIKKLLDAMSGKALPAGEKWHIHAGAYEVPTITINEDDYAGALRTQPMVSRRDNCNQVKGIFTDESSSWQPTDFPAYPKVGSVYDVYLAQDNNERVARDLDLSPFVTSGTQAQRLAKIELLKIRNGLSDIVPCKLTAYAAMTGRTVARTDSQLSWTAQPFEVDGSRFSVDQDGRLGVELSLRKTDSTIYDWTTAEEQALVSAGSPTLPTGNPVEVPSASAVVTSGGIASSTNTNSAMFAHSMG